MRLPITDMVTQERSYLAGNLSMTQRWDPDRYAREAALLAELREDLRGELCNAAGRWVVDYVRLRFSAVKRLDR
jgi:hypothetical protein